MPPSRNTKHGTIRHNPFAVCGAAGSWSSLRLPRIRWPRTSPHLAPSNDHCGFRRAGAKREAHAESLWHGTVTSEPPLVTVAGGIEYNRGGRLPRRPHLPLGVTCKIVVINKVDGDFPIGTSQTVCK